MLRHETALAVVCYRIRRWLQVCLMTRSKCVAGSARLAAVSITTGLTAGLTIVLTKGFTAGHNIGVSVITQL